MTRASGYRPFECPHCGLIYRITSYSSMNFMDFKRWSDGRFDGRMVNFNPLLKCSCGKLFLDSQVKFGNIVYNDQSKSEPIPSVWEAICKDTKKFINQIIKNKTKEETTLPVAAPELPPPHAMRVDDQDISELVGRQVWGDDIELELMMHHRLWQHLNRMYCDQLVAIGREAIAKGDPPPVVPFFCQMLYQPTSEQVISMTRLLALFKTMRPDNWLVIMELQRELGLFEDALETFVHRQPGSLDHVENDGAMLNSLIQKGVTAPALVAYG